MNNKANHPDCKHGVGYKKSNVTGWPLATRETLIAGIPLLATGRELKDAVGVLESGVEAEIGSAATYRGVRRA